MRHPILMAGLFVAVAPSLGACGQSKVTECNALVEVLNKGAQDIHARTNTITTKPEAVAEYKALADAADNVANGAAAVELRTPELKKLSSDYQKVMKEFAKTARDIADSDAKDVAKMNAAANEMEKVGKEEEQLVDDINKFCQAP
jgi:hypothetical protein